VICGATDHWPARHRWQLQNLVADHGEKYFKTNGRGVDGRKFRQTVFDYFAFCHSYDGEKPMYIFDKKFQQRVPELARDYSVPEYFAQDLFSLMSDDDRPDHKWLLIGPRGSGSPFHTDPHRSSAWNAVMCGRKRVSFYPPHVVPPGVDEDLIESEFYAADDTMDWYRNTYPSLRPEDRPLEVIVEAGEICFIPSGWWHSVLNLDLTCAVTQNICSLQTFAFTAKDLIERGPKTLRKDFRKALKKSREFAHLAPHVMTKKEREKEERKNAQ
jgi:hypothetical protein